MLAARYWRRTVQLRAQPPPSSMAMPLTPREFLGIACSTPTLLYHPGPRGTANHIPGVGEASLALVLASKAAQPLKSTRGGSADAIRRSRVRPTTVKTKLYSLLPILRRRGRGLASPSRRLRYFTATLETVTPWLSPYYGVAVF
jgi:hypothetical protein